MIRLLWCMASVACIAPLLHSCGGGGGGEPPSAVSPAPPAPAPAPPPPAPAPGPAVPTVFSDACSGFYSSSFQLSSTRTVDAIVPRAKPAKGAAFSDPAYNTCVVRATSHAAEPPEGFARNDYSRRQAFNSDSSRFIVYSNNGSWHLYDAKTLGYVKRLPGPAADAEPQWHPSNPGLLYFLPSFGIGMKLLELDVASGQAREVAAFGDRLKARWPTANAAWTRSEGSPSADGRYWCFMVDDASNASLGVFTWDRDTDSVLGMLDTDGERPDHVSMSPSGNYCVVSGDGPRGTVAYSRDFAQQRQLLDKSEHSDIAIGADGDDVYVSIDFGPGDVFMVNLRTGARTVLFPTYLGGGSFTAVHVSGKGYRRPGWALVSTYAGVGSHWLHHKVFAVQLKATPIVYNLAHHHSVVNGYWTEPHASVNREFTKLLFNSNWESGNDLDVDAYLVDLPGDAVR